MFYILIFFHFEWLLVIYLLLLSGMTDEEIETSQLVLHHEGEGVITDQVQFWDGIELQLRVDSHLDFTPSGSRVFDKDKALELVGVVSKSDVDNNISVGPKKFYNAFEEDGLIHFIPHESPKTIPFYRAVVHQHYHHELTQADIDILAQYSTDAYKKLNIQLSCGIVDNTQLKFAQQLFAACWAAYQPTLPNMVFRRMKLSEVSKID